MSTRLIAPGRAPHAHLGPAPFDHVVQFYEQDSYLVAAIGRYVHPALKARGCAIVIATPAHLEALTEEMLARGLDPVTAAREGRYMALEASELLGRLLVEDWPDEKLFTNIFGDLFERAQAASKGERRVAVFGEMVMLLWTHGQRDAAIRLECLWNKLAETHSFSLLCGYPLKEFEREEHSRLFFNVCGEHSDVRAAEGYAARSSGQQRQSTFALSRQRARALQQEIRMNRERIVMLQNAARAGTWEMELSEETFSLSSKAASILGLHPRPMTLAELFQMMPYSGDREGFSEALRRARKGRKDFVTEFRLANNGDCRVISIRGRTFYNGGQTIMLGVLSDITSAA
jgi:PAS domain-containing protein